MTAPSERTLFRMSAAWTVVGLLGGLAYREITKAAGFTGTTELGVVHTHALVLGTVLGLGALALTRVFDLGRDGRFPWFVRVWNTGLAITVAGLAGRGTLQVLGSPLADGPAVAGIAGLGHILLTAGFGLFFLILGRRLRASADGAAPAGMRS